MFIKSDSRMVNKGDWFVALRGHRVDGHSYAKDAINRGASYVVLENRRVSKMKLLLVIRISFCVISWKRNALIG